LRVRVYIFFADVRFELYVLIPFPPRLNLRYFYRIDLDELNLPYDPSTFDLIHIRFAHSRVRPLLYSSSTSIRHTSEKLTLTQVRSFATLLSQALTLLRPGGLLLLFDYDLLPILADESTPLSAQAWHDAFSKSMKKAGMPLFGLDKVIPCFGGREVEGKDMRVPIGHGDGACFPPFWILSCHSLDLIMPLPSEVFPQLKPLRRSRDLGES
jgi:SAM-dependent methyltransferase